MTNLAGRSSCTPEWSLQGKHCPYGHSTGPPLSSFTWPKDAAFIDYVAACYALAPFLLAIGFPLALLWTRGTKEILSIIFFWIQSLAVIVLKAIFGLPRPAHSCLTSCGMPSGHTLVSVGVFTWLLLEVNSSTTLMSRWQKCTWTSVGGVLLLPVGWSRTITSDHSWAQVVVGGAFGVLLAAGWFGLLKLRCTFWLLKLMCAYVPIISENYPLGRVEEERPWPENHSERGQRRF